MQTRRGSEGAWQGPVGVRRSAVGCAWGRRVGVARAICTSSSRGRVRGGGPDLCDAESGFELVREPDCDARASGHGVDNDERLGDGWQLRPRVFVAIPSADGDLIGLPVTKGGISQRFERLYHDAIEGEGDASHVHDSEVAVECLPGVAKGGAHKWREEAVGIILNAEYHGSLEGVFLFRSGTFSSLRAVSAERRIVHSRAVRGH